MWDALVVTPLTQGLIFLNDLIQGMGAPYSWGFAIILFTLIVKIVTLPLNLQQARSMKATQELQPKLQELQKKHAKDKEKLAQAQMELYREHGVSPLGGCLPMLIQLPILFGLYQALYRLASTGEIVGQRFLWIPDLAFPTREIGMKWVWSPPPELEGGWLGVAFYLVLPVLTVVTQIAMQRMTTSSAASKDPQQAAMQQTMLIMPFMFGFITLQVPAGLTLYWVTSNLFSMIQQYFITGWGSLLPQKGDEKATKVKREAKASDVKGSTVQKGKESGARKKGKKKR